MRKFSYAFLSYTLTDKVSGCHIFSDQKSLVQIARAILHKLLVYLWNRV